MQYMAIPQGAPPVSLIEHCRLINKMAELQLEDCSQSTSVPSKEVDVGAEPQAPLQKVFKEKQ